MSKKIPRGRRPTEEVLRFTVQQHVRKRGSARTDHYQTARQQQGPPQNQPNQNQHPSTPPRVPNEQQVPQQPMACRQQPPRACFNCGDSSHFVAECPSMDGFRKPVQQQVNLCHSNIAGE